MSSVMETDAFPSLTEVEMKFLRKLATVQDYSDGAEIFRVGDAKLDLCVVESGQIEIQNPTDGDRVIAVHQAGHFAGDIDLLTGRPVIVSGVARGPTRILRVAHQKIRSLLNSIPSFGEKLIIAFSQRRKLLEQTGQLGLRVIGPIHCKETNLVREFLHRNFVPSTWIDADTPAGKQQLTELGTPKQLPVIECGDGRVLINPSLRELANCAGVWQACPDDRVNLAIVGAGPAGITAAVYAASEGLTTLLLDRLGPGGQAAGSSKIENFFGFPSGLSGAELATRGVLQMLKFGARMAAPVTVERIETGTSPDQPAILHLNCGSRIQADVVLIATGVRWRKLSAIGAERYEGAGVHYVCTAVEAHLYDGSDVAVIGAGNSAGQAVMYLSECCSSRRVHMIIRNQLGPGMSEYLTNRIRSASNVVVHEFSEMNAVSGDHRVDRVEIKNNQSKTHISLPCAAAFVFIGADPAAEWLPPEIARDDLGYLLTGIEASRSGRWPLADRAPCPLETTIPGILAAGDIRSGSTKRVGFAVGDGSLAVTCTHRLLAIQKQ